MNPILYKSTATSFDNNGIGILGDCIKCEVTENMNGAYELYMEYPIDGVHFHEIAMRSIITAKPNPTSEIQPFRVCEITRPIGGVITVYGQHISYDLSGIPVSPFYSTSAAQAISQIEENAVVPSQFTFWTDKSTTGNMYVDVPATTRSLLGGKEGSILDIYGGEYEFDKYSVKLHSSRGENRGVSIRYGKNLTDIKQEENCSSVYTGVYPYWLDSESGELVEIDGKIVNAEGTYNFTRIMVLDLSNEWEDAPTKEQLEKKAKSYMKVNKIGVPRVSITVSFVQLEQSEEYKNIALLERVSLCDTVNVEFEQLGVSTTAKCIRTVYDVLLERYISVDLGDARTGITESVASNSDVEQVKTDVISDLSAAITKATNQITGNLGGYVILHSSTGGKDPDEILIMDTPDINTATKVWRWNKAGLGYSSNGYNGPFGLAITQDGEIVANYITAGTLAANIIKAGILSDGKGKNFWNMQTGEFSLSAETTIGGDTVTNIADTAINNYDSTLNQQTVFNKLTNDGQTQGIYLSGGKLYINADYMKSGNIDADYISLKGRFRVGPSSNPDGYIGRVYGEDSAGVTVGVGMTNTGGQYGGNRIMVTDSGANMSSGNKSIYVIPNGTPGASGGFYINGDLTVTGDATINGSVPSLDVGNVYLSGKLRPNDGQNALYCDWRRVQGENDEWLWALCGFTYPQ